MKEKVFKALTKLGFKPEPVEDCGYCFGYEGMKLLYIHNEDDEDFLNISLPGIYSIEEGKMAQYCALAEKLNSALKYVKAYAFGDSMWLTYERKLFDGENLEKNLLHIILSMEGAHLFALKAIADIEANFGGKPGGASACEKGN